MGSAHVSPKSLAVCKNLTASLADEFTVPLLFNDLSLRNLRLLVGLFNILFNRSSMNDLFARWALGHRCVRRSLGYLTLFWVVTLGARDKLLFFLSCHWSIFVNLRRADTLLLLAGLCFFRFCYAFFDGDDRILRCFLGYFFFEVLLFILFDHRLCYFLRTLGIRNRLLIRLVCYQYLNSRLHYLLSDLTSDEIGPATQLWPCQGA